MAAAANSDARAFPSPRVASAGDSCVSATRAAASASTVAKKLVVAGATSTSRTIGGSGEIAGASSASIGPALTVSAVSPSAEVV